MNIVELFVRLKAMGLGGAPFKIADLPDASSVTESTTLPALQVGMPVVAKFWQLEVMGNFGFGGTPRPDQVITSVGRFQFREHTGVEQWNSADGGTATGDNIDGDAMRAFTNNTLSLGPLAHSPITLTYEFPTARAIEELYCNTGVSPADSRKFIELVVRCSDNGVDWTTMAERTFTWGDWASGNVSVPLVGENAQVKATAEQLADYVAASGKVVPFAAVNALDPATTTLEELIAALQTPAAPAALNMIDEEDETL